MVVDGDMVATAVTAGIHLTMDTIILDGIHLILIGVMEVMDMVITILDGTPLIMAGDTEVMDTVTTPLITTITTTLITEYDQVVTMEETLTTL